MVREYASDPVQSEASVAVIVKLKVPGAAGEPESRPADDSVSPEGSVPALTTNKYGDEPPDADIVWEYDTPAVPDGSEAGESVIVGHPPMLIEYD
jgi:hypothetical protein